MNRYMIELHHVVHEVSMYLADLEMYGDITHYNERYPVYVWIESLWDKDIIESVYGIKKVWSPLAVMSHHTSSLKDISYERGLI